MDEKMERRALRRTFSPLGWMLVAYSLLMNALVTIVAFVDMILIYAALENGASYTQEQVASLLAGNGWGYVLTAVAGLLVILLWKGGDFCREVLTDRGRPMKAGDFLALTAIFLSGQLVFTFLSALIEWFLNLFGLSAMEALETATMTPDTFSMFLYICLVAPISEELIFRGLVLRTLEPYGRRFAILGSAFAFALFHGNLVQIPYAFLVGLVLGYVAVEHNIYWAMLLHM